MFINSIPMVPLDYTKPPEDLLVDIINVDNGTTLVSKDLVFGVPELSNSKHNSSLVITASKATKLKGSTTIFYNRVDIADIPDGRSTLFLVDQSQTMMADLIPQINAAYNLNLTSRDYINTTIPKFNKTAKSTETVELVMANTSLIFLNKLTLTLELSAISLTELLINTILDGLYYTLPAFTSQVIP